MSYSKPEITVLGDAFHVIQSPPFKDVGPAESSSTFMVIVPAYNLDD